MLFALLSSAQTRLTVGGLTKTATGAHLYGNTCRSLSSADSSLGQARSPVDCFLERRAMGDSGQQQQQQQQSFSLLRSHKMAYCELLLQCEASVFHFTSLHCSPLKLFVSVPTERLDVLQSWANWAVANFQTQV